MQSLFLRFHYSHTRLLHYRDVRFVAKTSILKHSFRKLVAGNSMLNSESVSCFSVRTEMEDDSIEGQTNDEALTDEEIYALRLNKINERLMEFKQEYETITKALVKFDHFLRVSSILPSHYPYERYLYFLMNKWVKWWFRTNPSWK